MATTHRHSPPTAAAATKIFLLLLLSTTILHSTALTERNTKPNTNNNHEDDNFYCMDIKHLHLSSGHDASSSVTVSFSSASSCIPHYHTPHSKHKRHDDPVGIVAMGKSPTDFTDWSIVLETTYHDEDDYRWSSRYNASNVRGKIDDHSLYISDPYHHVTIDNLESDEKYYYRCFAVSKDVAESLEVTVKEEDALEEEEEASRRLRHLFNDLITSRALKSKEHLITSTYFTTAPKPGPNYYHHKNKNKPIKFAFIGDLGRFDHSMETVHKLDSESFSAIILAGDIAYTNNYHPRWDEWFHAMSATPRLFLRNTLLQVAAGNHDIEQDEDSFEIFKSYEHRFRMPRIQPPHFEIPTKSVIIKGDTISYPLPYEYGNSYYSFVYGPSHHIVLNSYVDIRPSSAQYKWLVKELKEEVNRTVTPWLFVTAHCPMYNTFRGHQDDEQSIMFRTHIEPLFYEYKVNIFMTGHVHAYMRSKPVYQQQVNPKGTVYIIAGTGGYKLNSIYLNVTNAEEWVEARNNSTFGYGTLTLRNETHAYWDRVQTGFEEEGKGGLKRAHPVRRFSDEGMILNQLYL